MQIVAVARWRFGSWRVEVAGFEAEVRVRKAAVIASAVRSTVGADAAAEVVVRFRFPAEVAVHIESAEQLQLAGRDREAQRALGAAVLKLRSKRMPDDDIAFSLGIPAVEAAHPPMDLDLRE